MQELFKAHYNQNGIDSTAVYSSCKKYRYSLTKTIPNPESSLLFILLNPSTATEFTNDPTVSRCQARTKILGFDSFRVCNLFAYRTKSPQIMKNCLDPIGPQNDLLLRESMLWATKIICAWGSHGTYLSRAKKINKMIALLGVTTYHFGLTKTNQPKHPLYISYSQKLIRRI